jgi:hypothetical protein
VTRENLLSEAPIEVFMIAIRAMCAGGVWRRLARPHFCVGGSGDDAKCSSIFQRGEV